MKILVIDRPGFHLQTWKTLIESGLEEAEVETLSTLGELYLQFQKETYDVVVIDPTVENGQEFIDFILLSDPQQQILVVSDSDHCVIQRCPDCVANHQIRRLNNPTPIKNILRMLGGFTFYGCDHYSETSYQG